MNKFYFINFQIIIYLLGFQFMYAQSSYNMGDVSEVSDSEGFFYDSGGPSGDYEAGTIETFTICPENTGCVVMDFDFFITENTSNLTTGDVLTIYDGPDTSSPIIGVFSGSLINSNNAFGQVFAGSGCMTLEFDANSTIQAQGWEASWTSFTSTCPTYSTLLPPVDCENAILVCGEEPLNYNSNGYGIQELSNGEVKGCLGGKEDVPGESQSAWFIVNISESAIGNTPLEFTIKPKPGGKDYDFAIYGPVGNCDELGSPIRCSFAKADFAGTPETGLSIGETDFSETAQIDDEGDPSNGFVEAIDVNPGDTYYIIVNNHTTNNVGFDLDWGDDVISNGLLDCSICDFAVIMPQDTTFCQGTSFTIPVETFKGSGNFNYQWTSDVGTEYINFTGESTLEVTPNVNFSGLVTFNLVVTDENVNNCIREESITVTIESNFILNSMNIDPTLCPEESTSLSLSGNFGANPIFNWNFGNAIYEGGDSTSIGPIQLSWMESGVQEVTVNVLLGECSPDSFIFTTDVFPVLEMPEVACPELSSDSTFTWNAVTGADNYTVTWFINNVEVGSEDVNGTEFIVEGGVGNTVEVIVTPNSIEGSCSGEEGTSGLCMILACELPTDFGIEGLNPTYCLGEDSVLLVGNPIGGTFTVEGENVDFFDPSQEEGFYIVEYAYVDLSGCIFSDIDTVVVLGTINVDFALPDSVCTGELADIIYEAAIGVDTILTWNLEEGTPSTVEDSDSIEVVWENAGVFDVELILSSNGCELGTLIQEITVLQTPILPELNCNDAGIGIGSVGWTIEDNHLYYYNAFVNGVSVNGGFLPTSAGDYIHPNNLETGDTLEVQVFAAIDGQSFCGTSDTVSVKCPINSCTDTPLIINGLAENYCMDDNDVVEIITEPSGGILTISGTLGLTGNTFNIADAGVGTHTFIYTWEDADGCPNDTTFTTSIFENPEALFSINPSSICEGETATITYTGETKMTNYEWDFGEEVVSNTPLGNESYELTWNGSGRPTIELVVTLNGCNSAPAIDSIEIIAAPQIPVLSCDNSVEGCITFNWEVSETDSLYTFSYVVTPPDGLVSFGSMTIEENFYTLCDLEEGTTVRISNLAAVGMSPCGNSAVEEELTCTAQSCSENLEINDLPVTACIDDAVINFNFVAPNGASISGNGVTQNSSSTASFSPSIAGIGTHEITLTYTDASGDCPTFTETAEIEVIGLPIADFNIVGTSTTFCEGEEVNFTHASTSTNDFYLWNFGVGASPATSSLKSPPTVTYSSQGIKTITLQVGNDGCSDETSQEITIVSPLQTPIVICGQSSQTEITFDWTNITGNTGYNISYTIETNPSVSLNIPINSTSYTVDGLTPNQNVSITVIAVGSDPCGNSEAGTQNCIAQNCPVVNPVITNLDSDYCSDECGNVVTLTATPSGGVFTLNGDLVTEFDPCGLSGMFTILYSYSENDDACIYQTSQQVTVNTTPIVTIGLTENDLCVDGETSISFEGTAGTTAAYSWSFGTSANPVNANTQGSHNISWTSSGTKNITLEVTENNCVAEGTTTLEVSESLDSPIITCTASTQNSVGFAWNDVGGTGEYIYDVYVNGTLEESAQSTFDLTYSLGSLEPEDEVRIVLYAVGNTICGDSEIVEQTCSAENCPVLPTPIVICTGSTQNSVGFAWDDVGGTGEYIYDVYVNGTLEESAQSTFDLTYSLGSLEPEDEVRIVLYALGNNPCETSLTVEQTCIAENCPVLSPNMENIEASCQGIGEIPLGATNTGGDGTGTGIFTFNGEVITKFDTNRPAGIYTINYVYTQGSCSGFDSQEVEIYELPLASIAALADACEGEMREIVFDGTAPIGSSFTWDFGENVLSSTEVSANSWEVVWSSGGSKTVQLWIDFNGCKDSTSVDLNIAVPLETPVVSCRDVTTNQVGFEWTAMAATYQVNVFVNTVPVFEDLAYVGEEYIATGLAVEDAVSIEVIPLGDAPCGNGTMGTADCFAAECPDENLDILMDNTSFCLDEEANILEASIVGATFTIGNDPTPVNSFNPAIVGVGTHMVYCNYTNPDTNCPYVDSLEVNVFDTPVADFTIELQACIDETLTLEFTGSAPNTSADGFNWGNFAGVDEVSNLGGGVYELTWNSSGTKMIALEITTDDGCTSSFDQTIEVTNVELDMPAELSVNQGGEIDIEVDASSSTSDIVTYTWENIATLSCDDCPNPTANPTTGTLYTLSVEDADACTETANVFVDVIIPEPLPEIAIPTAFSPNGDNINDVFRPVFNQLVVGMHLQIYNRWGEMVFESQDINVSWDGKYGKNRRRFSPVGTYVYKIMVEHADGSSQLLQGNLTIIY